MDSKLFDSVPVDRREATQLALTAAFGAKPITGLQQIFGGVSALTYRINMAENSYVLRLDTRSAIRNPERGYLCMQTAANAGIAPRVHYANGTDGIAIMDFVVQRPLSEYPGGAECLLRDLGKLISKLQAIDAFPILGNYATIIERMFAYVRSSNVFATGLLDPHLEAFERIRKAYHRDEASLVSSHNDPNPRNILFDGERLWLIDWETAYRNDPLTDIAILADNFAKTPELENILLHTWLGREADRTLRARFVLMRHLTRLYYAGLIFSAFARAPRTAPDASLKALSDAEFRLAFVEGRLKAGTSETAYELGKMFLSGFITGANAPGFDEALAIAAT